MRQPNESKILDEEEVQYLAGLIRTLMPEAVRDSILSSSINPEDVIRVRSLAATFRNARENASETLKDTSGKTGIPQYRIRAIEQGQVSLIKPSALRELASYFHLDAWCSEWAGVNHELAERLGMLSWSKVRRIKGRKSLPESVLQPAKSEVASFVESRRPSEHIRPKLDIGYRISGQSFVIFELRPRWRQPDSIQEIPVAKATYVKSRKVWKLYWRRADLKWHRYDPLPDTESLQVVLDEIGEDPYGCFWG